MNKKRFSQVLTVLAIICLLLSIAVLTVGCKDDSEVGGVGTAITPPIDAAIDSEGLISWTRVSGAASYELDVNGTIVEARFTRYDLYSHTDKPENGAFEIRLRSVARDGTKSEWSSTLSYTMEGGALMHPMIVGVDHGVISWYSNANALSVVVSVNGVESTLSKETTQYSLVGAVGDSVTFSLYFKGDGVYYRDSAVNTVIYNAVSDSMSLPSPKNVRMEGQVLTFDAVIGADVYYLRDYNNTVISVRDNVVDMSSGFLTKSVWAGSTTGDYGDSTEAGVTYFGEDSGEGTEQNPFVIRTADEFRYIEYYEGIGEARYYALGNDILFEDIELSQDDFGSNAYKFGSFSGVLDGKNHSLRNLKVYYRDGYSSLFSSITQNAKIKNLVIENADWRTWTVKTNDGVMHEKGGDVAILCYTNRGEISNVTLKNSSVVAVTDGAAGLVSINRGTITGCTVDSDVYIYGNLEGGGIAIFNEGNVSNCKNYGTVEGNFAIGGIIGRNAGLVSACDNFGNIKGSRRIGGIVGYNYNVYFDGAYDYQTEVRYCSNHGTIEGSNTVGGIVGQNGTDGTDEIGLANAAGAGIRYCYNLGEVKGFVAGGIVGSNFAVKGENRGVVGCYNSAQVSSLEVKDANSKRIIVDASSCLWVANDNARMYCYYWGSSKNIWPGEPMSTFISNGRRYYFIDIIVESIVGIVFSRCGYSGNVYNKTVDITPEEGKYLYTLDSQFEPMGSWSSSASVESLIPKVCGAIAGYNASVDDCYYLTGVADVIATAYGTAQNNTVNINGVNNAANAAISEQYLASEEFVTRLNTLAGTTVWKMGDGSPKFIWQ